METQVTQRVNQEPKENRLIKKYENRKLYDTRMSAYVTLDDLAKMVRQNYGFSVIENKTKNDITALTLMQIAFENEKRVSEFMPIPVLKEIIKTTGSISKFLLSFGIFTQEQMLSQERQKPKTMECDLKDLDLEFQPATANIKIHDEATNPVENALPTGIIS
jgi:polyhydroxyalkanoate synthesis repressor PhaR